MARSSKGNSEARGGRATRRSTGAAGGGRARGQRPTTRSSRSTTSAPRRARGAASGRLFQALTADHRTVQRGLAELRRELEGRRSRTGDARCLKAFAQIFHDLVAHSRAEDQVVYNAALADGSAAHLIFEAREEHAIVDRVLEELRAHEEVDEVWSAKIKVLADLVDHHVEEEETQLFKRLRADLDRGELDRLSEEFEHAKEAIAGELEGRGQRGMAGVDHERTLHS